VVFRLDFCQVSFNRVENEFATRQLAVLATSIAFYDIPARAWALAEFFFAFLFSPFFFILLQYWACLRLKNV